MAYTDQLRGNRVPYFSGHVTARAVLDAASLTYWLSEPRIGTEARVQRGQAVALAAGLQMLRAPQALAPVTGAGSEILSTIENGARALGWATTNRKDSRNRPSVGDQAVPRPEAAIRALLDDPAKPNTHPDEAAALWWHLSAYTHSSLHLLMGHIEAAEDAEDKPSPFGLPQGRIYTNGSNVSTVAFVLGRGVKKAMTTYRNLMGVGLPHWDEIHERWWETLVHVFDSMPLTDRGA